MNDSKFAEAVKQAQMRSNSEASLIEAFANAYFSQFADCDLEKLSPERLGGMLLTHLDLLLDYDGSHPMIRVFNPELERDGFHSSHTVIEMAMRDRPFLVDTLTMCLDELGLGVHLLGNAVIAVRHDEDGGLAGFENIGESDAPHMSVIYCEVDRQTAATACKALAQALETRIDLLDVIVNDWSNMHAALRCAREELRACPLEPGPYSMAGVVAFIDWLLDGNFTFIGYRGYRLDRRDREIHLDALGGSGLGILREDGNDHPSQSFAALPPEIKAIVIKPQVLQLSKSSHRALVHRPVYLDFVGIQRFDETGAVIGEHRFLGLFTASAYQLTPDRIPLLREKYHAVMARAGLPEDGHGYKRMRHILNQFPRDELFQNDLDTLYPMLDSIMHLYDRRALRLFVRVDHYRRFVSCLIYIPRDKHSTALRLKIQDILMEAFAGIALEFNTQFSEASHARIHVHVRTRPNQIRKFDVQQVEQGLNAAMRGWDDELAAQIRAVKGEGPGGELLKRFAGNYPLSYQEDHTPDQAIIDTERLCTLGDGKALAVHLYRAVGEEDSCLHLKLYGRGTPAALTEILPRLEHFGVAVSAVHPYAFSDRDGNHFWLQQYDLTLREAAMDMQIVHERFENALRQVWNDEVESDRFNALILRAGLDSDEVTVLRALSRYMIQARAPFSNKYLERTLEAHPARARGLIELFHARFDPARAEGRGESVAERQEAFTDALEQVKSLDEERILRWYLDLIGHMVRTNFYQREHDGTRKNRLSFKFRAADIEKLPKPRPLFEIFVYSPRMEGCHLRGGKVARGGLRWSDRRADFRTEVLGLMKAQMVKNALIVPVGSKGGFVLKNAPDSREALLAEGKACYRTFISGMLDLSDNIVDGAVVAPDATVRHDEDDPYLVVAADKGTATFSDLANEVAAEYGFWLGDAFASGGSVGYDHKAMGITARGAWESVKRHLRMDGLAVEQRKRFTVIGIGDMSGDVFGNGMLLSEKIHLVAAFNHLHIFIDPNPDPAMSFEERRRLFALPRSNWADYDRARISKGGGVFSRQDKSVPISEEMKQVFALTEDQLTPTELIKRLLKAPVDILWNGGIGTYVKSSAESDVEVGDRGNDSLRIDGNQVGAKIIGEGGNLGMTQRGRIEAAQNGVRLYTDAIDNSAGVNCSDHEVNIKILLNDIVAKGRLTEKQRRELLASMADEVAALVLEENILQPQALEMAAARPDLLADHARIIRHLEKEGRLDREIESLPDEQEISHRLAAGRGLTRPELAVILAYGKTWLYDHLLASGLPENAYFLNDLPRYFPQTLGERFPQEIRQHPLHREIIATCVTNSLVNRMGSAFVFRAVEESGLGVAEVASAYVLAREVFGARDYWGTLRRCDNRLPATVHISLQVQVSALIEQAVYWFLHHLPQPIDVARQVARFAAPVATLLAPDGVLGGRQSAGFTNAARALEEQGLDSDLAAQFVRLPSFSAALDIVLLAEQSETSLESTAKTYHSVDEMLHGALLREMIASLPNGDYWARRATGVLLARYGSALRAIARARLRAGDQDQTQWLAHHRNTLARLEDDFQELSARTPNQAMVSVLLEEIAALAG